MMPELYRFSHFSHYPSLLHAVSQKSAAHPYAFSLAMHTGEEPQKILQNRIHFSTLLEKGKSLHYIVANQTHSDHIELITQCQTKGWHTEQTAIADCDALITDIPGVILTILTADCVPILLYDKKKKVVAAIHAGWKGTRAQIASKTIQKMQESYGSDPLEIIAGIAPSIGSCCYEVGKEVAEHFFDTPEFCIPKKEKYMLDLPAINRYQLLQAGLSLDNIQMSGVCTACNVEKFFSYRQEKGCSGRFMSTIGLA